MMDEITQELDELFAGSAPDGLAQGCPYRITINAPAPWHYATRIILQMESYSMKMGADDTKLDLNTVRAFKRDVQDSLERETRGKNHQV